MGERSNKKTEGSGPGCATREGDVGNSSAIAFFFLSFFFSFLFFLFFSFANTNFSSLIVDDNTNTAKYVGISKYRSRQLVTTPLEFTLSICRLVTIASAPVAYLYCTDSISNSVMATVTAFRRPASIAYLPNQSPSFYSTMDRSYRSNRPPQHPSSNHHILHSSPHSHHPHFGPQQHRPTMTTASYPLVYSPSENLFNTPTLSADIQHEYPFELGLASHPSMSFAEFDLSQSDFLNPGQLPWSDSKSELKSESSPASQPVFYAEGSYSFYNNNGNPAIDSQLFTSQPQPHAQPQHSSEMLTSAPQVVYFTPSAENEMDMEGDLVHYPTSSPSPHALPPTAAAPTFVHPSEVMSPSPPAFAPVPFPRVPGSSSPPGLTGESDEDLGSESGESEAAYPSDGMDGDSDFMPNRTMSRSRTRSRRTSSVSVSSSSGSVRAPRPCRLSAPVPVPNLTKKSRGRRVPTSPVMIVQGGVQKNMRMYRCTVEGCYKCFARGEHLKRHIRSIHTNEKCEFFPPLSLARF